MSDFNYSHKTEEMFKHFIDRDKVIDAYPELVTTEIVSEFNQETNEYVVKQLASLNIDRDVLAKQAEEIQRLRNLCKKAYEQGKADAIDEFAEWVMYFVDGYYFKFKEELLSEYYKLKEQSNE